MTPPFRFTIRGLHELARLGETGFTHVLSILDPGAATPEVVARFAEDRRLELRFYDALDEVPGRTLFAPEHLGALLSFGRRLPAGAGTHLLVHCTHGVSRSPTATVLLLAQAMPEAPGSALFAEVLRARSMTWPNIRILEMGDAALGRAGELVRAARAVYWRQLQNEPGKAEELRRVGRGREVALAAPEGTE